MVAKRSIKIVFLHAGVGKDECCATLLGDGGSLTRRDVLGRLACLTGCAVDCATAQTPLDPATDPRQTPFKTLRPSHPRLFLADSELDRVRQTVRDNAVAKRCYNDLEKESDRLLSTPPVEYRYAGTGLRTPSRRVFDRILTLALMYRLTGRDPWLRRAIMELKAAANFKDWNPTRFIDCAEMTFAFAVGYDWLYPVLSPDERALVRAALVTKGFDVARPTYLMKNWWSRERFHWNIVCNASMMAGALAIAEPPSETGETASADAESQGKALEVARAALESITHGLSTWGVDGGWPEGTMYGALAARYTALFLASLETAVGSDLGLGSARGFDRYGRFRLHTTGPTNRLFECGEGAEDPGTAPEMFWLAKRYGGPAWAWHEQRQMERTTRPEPLDLVWFVRDARSPAQPPTVPLDLVFSGVAVATFRSAWDDPNALFFAFKGGDNKAPHAHPDLGSFVLDAGGVRWALDAGADDLATPSPQRPARSRTEFHNTLVFDGENQDLRAEARIIRQELGPDLSWAQLDITRANGKIRQWTRRAGIVQRQMVLLEDVVRADQAVEMVWGMSTDAEVAVNGPTAILRKNGWSLFAEIRTPRHAIFDIATPRQVLPNPSGGTQVQGHGVQRLVIRLVEKVVELNLTVALTPYRDGQNRPKPGIQFPA